MDRKEALLKIVHKALENDKTLRETYRVGEKFRFIRDRLNALVLHVEEDIKKLEAATIKKSRSAASATEVMVYVYLYNAQGLNLASWQKMLGPGVLYEYSVNRPIYSSQSAIEAFIKSKANRVQHAYLSILVHKSDILSEQSETTLIRVKEGALKPNNLLFFTHNAIKYEVNEGQLIKL